MQTELSYRDEPVSVEPRPVWEGFHAGGNVAVETQLCEMVEALVIALSRAEQYHAGGKTDRAADQAREIVMLARSLGLGILAGVAESVMDCAQRGDWVALAAVMGRLVRIGDKSLSVIWNTPGEES